MKKWDSWGCSFVDCDPVLLSVKFQAEYQEPISGRYVEVTFELSKVPLKSVWTFCLSTGTLIEKVRFSEARAVYLVEEATDPNHLPVRISLVT